MSKVFCIGNGESRKDFDLNVLQGKGKVYGCNAIYRDYPELIDVLTAVDNGIIHEIYHSGFALKKPCYFRNWTKVPADMYQSIVEGFVSKQELDELKDYDVIRMNERENATEFVIHGTTLQGMVSILRNAKKDYPRSTKDIVKKQIKSSQINVSWIKEGDQSHDIREVWEEYKDHGWACGASSGFVAVKKEQPKEIYLIGHDLLSDTNKVNNMYKDTKHYVTSSNTPTPAVNWINQWYTLMEWNPNTQFFKVNKDMDTTPTNSKITEWTKWHNDGRLQYITQAQLLDNISKW